MDDQYQQLETGVLPLAALATAVAVAEAEHREIVRIAQAAKRAIGGSYASDRLPYLHRIMRNAFPDRDLSTERWQAILTGVVAPAPPGPVRLGPVEVPDDPDDEEAPERTCECQTCTDDGCQGDCDECDDHGCTQCYDPDDHGVLDCCGYCPGCENHPDNYRDVRNYHCAECDRCSECEHYCS